MRDLTIIIINYNTADYTIQCLNSIKSAPPRCDHDIVVVDNASRGGDADQIAAAHPDVTLIRSAENLGFTGGNNLAAAQTTSKYLLLLNNDTLVFPNAIDPVVTFMDAHQHVGVAGVTVLNEDRTLQSTHMPFPSLKRELLINTTLGRRLISPYYPSAPRSQQVEQVDWMSGAYLMLRRDAFNQVGTFDDTFFMYGEECELQYRLKNAGWDAYYLPDAEIVHFGGKSGEQHWRRKQLYRGNLLFYRKHRGIIQTVALRLMFVLLSVSKWVVWTLMRLLPIKRERSRLEAASHGAIVAMCLRPIQ